MPDSWVPVAGWIAYIIALAGIVLIVREVRLNGFAFVRRPLPNKRSLFALSLALIGLGLRQWLGWKHSFQWPPWLFSITAAAALVAWFVGYAPPHVRALRAGQQYLASIRSRLYKNGSPALEPDASETSRSEAFRTAEANFRLAFEEEQRGKLSDTHHVILDRFSMPTSCIVCDAQLGKSWHRGPNEVVVNCDGCGAKLHLMEGSKGPGVQAILPTPRRVVGPLNRINCAAALHELGFLYRIVNRFEDALRYLEQALSQLEVLPRDGNRAYGAYFLSTMGDIHKRIGEIKLIRGASDEARTHLDTARTLLRDAGSNEISYVDDMLRKLHQP